MTRSWEEVQAALVAAASSGDAAKIESLINAEKASIDTDVFLAGINSSQRDAVFRTFASTGWHPDSYLGGHSGTPLMAIVEDLDAVKFLVSIGADPEYGRAGPIKPLDAAVLRSTPECAKYLIEKGAVVKNRNALSTAAYAGRLDMIEMLVGAGADVNEIVDFEETMENERELGLGTALHQAARSGQVEAAKLLIGKGARKEVKDSKGKTAKQVAEENGHEEVAQVL